MNYILLRITSHSLQTLASSSFGAPQYGHSLVNKGSFKVELLEESTACVDIVW
jgi:hypothetical protein